MFKKNKILAGSLAAVGAGSLVTGLGSNAVQADGSNLLKFLGSFELFRNLFYYLGLQEYKFSDMVFDHDMSLNLDSPMNEGDSIKIGKDELVATKIGDKDYNFLVWRIKDSEKSGKPIYVFDTKTYSKKVCNATFRDKKDIPSCVKYICDFNKANYNKESQLKMLEQRAEGIYNAFKSGKSVKADSSDLSKKYFNNRTKAKVFWDENKALKLPTPKRWNDKLKINGHEFVSIYDGLRRSWCWSCFDAGENKDMVLIYFDEKDPFRYIEDAHVPIKNDQKLDKTGFLSYFPDLGNMLNEEKNNYPKMECEHFADGSWKTETIDTSSM